MFLHNGITHLVVNSYSLYVLGTTVEMIMGKGRFLFIYLMAGLMGSIVSFIFFNSAVSRGVRSNIWLAGCSYLLWDGAPGTV